MKISDCKHQVEFNLSGFTHAESGHFRDFTGWSKLLWVQINQLSSKIYRESRHKTPDTLIMKTEVRNLLLIPIFQLFPDFNLDEGKAGRWNIIADDDCEDNTIFMLLNKDDKSDMFIPVFKKNKNEFDEISFVPKTLFTKEEVEEYEKKTRGCIILKNNFLHE